MPFVLHWDVPSSLMVHCPSLGESFLPWTSLRPHHLFLLAPPCLSASLDPFPCPLLSFSAPVIFPLPSSARSPSPPCLPCAPRYRSLLLIFHPGQSRTLILQRWMSRQHSCQRMPQFRFALNIPVSAPPHFFPLPSARFYFFSLATTELPLARSQTIARWKRPV